MRTRCNWCVPQLCGWYTQIGTCDSCDTVASWRNFTLANSDFTYEIGCEYTLMKSIPLVLSSGDIYKYFALFVYRSKWHIRVSFHSIGFIWLAVSRVHGLGTLGVLTKVVYICLSDHQKYCILLNSCWTLHSPAIPGRFLVHFLSPSPFPLSGVLV